MYKSKCVSLPEDTIINSSGLKHTEVVKCVLPCCPNIIAEIINLISYIRFIISDSLTCR